MDLKVMPRSYTGHKYILWIIDEVTRLLYYYTYTSSHIRGKGDALIENVITKYYIPEYIIMDQDSTFTSSVINYLFNKFDIKIKTIVPYNHQSL